MTKNPVRPGRYRPGKAVAEEPSSSEEEEDEDDEAQKEQERRQAEVQRRKQQAPKASSFPAAAARKIEEEDEDEDGFVTDEEEEEAPPAPVKATIPAQAGQLGTSKPRPAAVAAPQESEEDDEEEEESSEEESSSEDEAPRRVLVRPTFIKKDKRANASGQNTTEQAQAPLAAADSAADNEARRAQRQEKADHLVRDQLEKDAIARSAGNRAWDDDELVQADEEEEIDDRDGVDPEGEYAAWKLRELKRVKREREAIEEAEKEREEIERRRNLTAEERDREDQEYIANQKADREANRGETGFMQRYFHKGAFFRDDLEKEGLDQRNVMGRRFVDEVATETLPQYMQVRDMTKLGKKGRTRYRDLKTEDTGRFGDGFENRRRRDGPPIGITDERFMPDHPGDRGQGPTGPTGANASTVRQRRRSKSRSRSPQKDRHNYRDDRSRSRERRKRSPSPYDDRDKRRRVDST